MAAPKRSRESTTDEFLDLPRHISFKIATTENDIKREISVVGQSDSRFCTNMKKKKKERLFPSMRCSHGDVENRGKARLH